MTASGVVPPLGKGALPPSMAEADEFLDEVDDVARLIEGLHSGKISAEYVDKRINEKAEEEAAVVMKEQKKVEDAEKAKYENLPDEKKREIKEKVSGRLLTVECRRGGEGKKHPQTPHASRRRNVGTRSDACSRLHHPASHRTAAPPAVQGNNPPVHTHLDGQLVRAHFHLFKHVDVRPE